MVRYYLKDMYELEEVVAEVVDTVVGLAVQYRLHFNSSHFRIDFDIIIHLANIVADFLFLVPLLILRYIVSICNRYNFKSVGLLKKLNNHQKFIC